VANKPTLVSSSIQIDHNATTNYSANRHIDHTAVSITAGAGLTGGGDISSTRTLTALYIPSTDARAVNNPPASASAGLYADFKTNTTDGLVDGGTYHGVLTFRPYGITSDFSGGPAYQEGFTQNGNLYLRSGSLNTWSSWRKLAYETGSILGSSSFALTSSAATSITFNVNTGSFTGSFIGTHSGSTFGTSSWAQSASNLTGGATNYIPVWTSATLQSSSNIYQSAGNVGIGTASPAYKLDVSGSIGLSGFLFALKSGNYTQIFEPAGNTAIYLGNATDPSNYYDNTAHWWRTRGGGTVNMYLNSVGLGLGTLSPLAKLDVRGSVLVGTGSATNTMGATNYIAISTPTIGQSTGLEFYGAAAPYNPRAWITHTHTVSSQALTFNSTFSSGTGYANFIFSNGNVGIGTTSPNPSSRLHISGSSTTENADHGTFTMEAAGVNGLTFGYDSSAQRSWIYSRTAGFTGRPINLNGTLYVNGFNTGVGIGVTAPDTNLSIVKSSGGLPVSTGTTPTTAITRIKASANNAMFMGMDTSSPFSGWIQVSDITGLGTNYPLLLNPNGGNVGIGTTNPVAKLHVQTAVSKSILISDASHATLTSNLGSAITFNRPSDGTNNLAGIFGWNNGGLAISAREGLVLATGGASTYSATAEAVRIDTSGNVGIGTTNPTAKLVVNPIVIDASVHTYSANATVLTHQTATSTTVLNDPQEVLVLARQGTSGQAYGAAVALQLSRYKNTSVDSNTRLDFVLANTAYLSGPNTVMTLQSEGRVGIGTSLPGATLHIQGNVSASSYTGSFNGDGSQITNLSVPPALRPFYAATLGGF
jgi:hypothetical protein